MREAACAVLVAEAPTLRVLWVKRAAHARFLPGLHTFPGGALDPADAAFPNDGGGDDVLHRVAALRELFEETGILVLHGGVRTARDGDTQALRALLRHDVPAAAACFREAGYVWGTASLSFLGRWTAPDFATTRFDTRFYGCPVPAPADVYVEPEELAEGEWVTPAEGLARWARAEVRVGPPVAAVFRAFHAAGRFDAAAASASHGADGVPSLRFEVVPGVQMMPVRSPTLPPATHTNVYLVGTGDAVLVEPASPYEDELNRIVAWVEENRRVGVVPSAILATHHHPDHIGGALALKERLGLPLHAHAMTAQRLHGRIPVDRIIEDGEVITMEGPTPMALTAVHTPGHAPGHLCFVDQASSAMISGDMVAGVGSIIVEPVDGDMQLYLDSLRLMADRAPSVLLPAHGGPIDDVQGILSRYTAHRLAREAKVMDALSQAGGTATPEALLPIAYADTPEALWPLARMSTEAHLIKLERDGRVRSLGDRWQLV